MNWIAASAESRPVVRPSDSSPETGSGTPTEAKPETVAAEKSSTRMPIVAVEETSFFAPTRDSPESTIEDESTRVVARSDGSDENSSAAPPATGRAIDTLAAVEPVVPVKASVLRP